MDRPRTFRSLLSTARRFGRRSALLRTLLLSLLIGVVLLAALSGALYSVFASYSVAQTLQVSQDSLGQAAASMDQMLESLFRQMEREYRTNSNLIMGMESGAMTAIDYAAVFRTLGGIVDSNEAFDSAYVYNPQADVFFSSIGVMQPAGEFYDPAILEILRRHKGEGDSPRSHAVSYRLLEYTYGTTRHQLNAITFVFSEPGNPAALIFNINQASLQRIIASGSQDEAARSLILGQDGTVISDSWAQEIFDSVAGEPYFDALSVQTAGTLRTPVGGRDTLISFRHFNQYTGLDWIIAQMYDYGSLTGGFRQILSRVWIISAGVAALLVLGLFLVVGRISVPMERVLRLAGEAAPDAPREDEFAYLEQSILSLSEHQDQAGAVYDLPTLRRLFLLSLAREGAGDSFEDQCRRLGLEPEGEYTVVLLRPGPEEAPAVERRLSQAFGEAPGLLILRDPTLGLVGGAISVGFSQARLWEGIALAQGGAKIPGGVSGALPLRQLNQSYAQALVALDYAYLFGPEALTFYPQVAERESAAYQYPIDREQALLAGIKAGQDPQAALDLVVTALRGMSVYQAQLALRQLLLALLGALPQEAGSQMTGVAEYAGQLERLPSLQAAQEWLLALCRERLGSQRRKRDERLRLLVDDIKAIVEQRYAQFDLSVESIAAQVQLSPNYVRTLFKDQEGVTLSRYISDLRFDHALLLLRSTDLPANRIGEMVGFPMGNYFYTAFKRATGKTPEEVRRESRRN